MADKYPNVGTIGHINHRGSGKLGLQRAYLAMLNSTAALTQCAQSTPQQRATPNADSQLEAMRKAKAKRRAKQIRNLAIKQRGG